MQKSVNMGRSLLRLMGVSAYLCLVLMLAITHSRGVSALAGIIIGPATPQDLKAARQVLFKLKMNPIIGTEADFFTAKNSDDNSLVGFGQIRPLGRDHAELASVYVQPEFRRKGVATDLISALIGRHDAASPSPTLCLLTLESTTPLYERFGFTVVSNSIEVRKLPRALQFELLVGKGISFFLKNSLACMVRRV